MNEDKIEKDNTSNSTIGQHHDNNNKEDNNNNSNPSLGATKREAEEDIEAEREIKKIKFEESNNNNKEEDSNNKLIMKSGAASNIGELHHEFHQPNQDNFLINDEKKIYAVFDGHGDKGHVISNYLRENLVSAFSSSLSPSHSIAETFRNSFKLLDDHICKSYQSESSGSTCVMAYVNNNHLYIAGVGDCTAMLVEANPTSGKIDTTTLLSVHKISNESEQQRITENGAQINGEYIVCKTDANKVINMTRAFGDRDMKSAGIISRPDISITKLSINNNNIEDKKDKEDNNDGAEHNNNDNNSINNNRPENIAGENSFVNHFDTSSSNQENDTFLMLFSDGLDQVQNSQEIASKTHQLLRENLKEKGEAMQVNTICSSLLQKLEDGVYDRDGIGFSDDSTVVVVLLSGFS